MDIKEISKRVAESKNINYRDKVSLTRELYVIAIRELKKKNIVVDEQNPFDILKEMPEDTVAKEILEIKERLKEKRGTLIDS